MDGAEVRPGDSIPFRWTTQGNCGSRWILPAALQFAIFPAEGINAIFGHRRTEHFRDSSANSPPLFTKQRVSTLIRHVACPQACRFSKGLGNESRAKAVPDGPDTWPATSLPGLQIREDRAGSEDTGLS